MAQNPQYKITNVNHFISDMYHIFLTGKVKPAKLIVAEKPENDKQTQFLGFALNILKSIKIHAKFTWLITITKQTNSQDPLTITVKLHENADTETGTDENYNIRISNSSSSSDKTNQLVLPDGKNDSYILDTLLRENNDTEIKNKINITSYKSRDGDKSKDGDNSKAVKKYNYNYSIQTADSSQDNTTMTIAKILHKEYSSNDEFTIKIKLTYTKPNASTIIIQDILIYNLGYKDDDDE